MNRRILASTLYPESANGDRPDFRADDGKGYAEPLSGLGGAGIMSGGALIFPVPMVEVNCCQRATGRGLLYALGGKSPKHAAGDLVYLEELVLKYKSAPSQY